MRIRKKRWFIPGSLTGNDTDVTATPDDESEVVKLGLPALVLGLLAALTLAVLAVKAFCDRRSEKIKEASETASTASSSSAVSVSEAVHREAKARERLKGLVAPPPTLSTFDRT